MQSHIPTTQCKWCGKILHPQTECPARGVQCLSSKEINQVEQESNVEHIPVFILRGNEWWFLVSGSWSQEQIHLQLITKDFKGLEGVTLSHLFLGTITNAILKVGFISNTETVYVMQVQVHNLLSKKADIDENIAMLKCSRVFLMLDAKSGFWQIPLHAALKHVTTITTPLGRCGFKWHPFDCLNPPPPPPSRETL